MRAVLLGLLAVVLLTEDADAAQDLGSLRSANALMPSCQTFLIDGVLKSPAEGFCVGVVVGLGYASRWNVSLRLAVALAWPAVPVGVAQPATPARDGPDPQARVGAPKEG
jgi:hypothetical protein